MQLKFLFIFLIAVAYLSSATAYNCTALDGENYNVCKYIENTEWSQEEKDSVISDMINSGDASLNGDFEPLDTNQIDDSIEFKTINNEDSKISEENKRFLLDLSSFSIFGYFIWEFLKQYFLLWRFI
jgi:hypothetical protein